jgi:glutamyl-tRNA synthetase
MNDLEKTIYKHALLNAKKHGSKANSGAVIGSIMSSESELRKKAKEISQIAGKIVNKVNKLSSKEQDNEIAKLGIKIEEKKQIKNKGLVELSGDHKNIVMRFAPNPSGPLHIGHARAAVPNGEYVKKYDGKLILRIEDTDPKRVYLPAYEMIQEDLKWLGIEVDEIYYQSDRFPIYYEYAEKFIKHNFAYMCNCNSEKFKKLKDESKPCPCRNLSVDENMLRWKEFSKLDEGKMVLRIKTDINHKNPAIRDWVAMRIVKDSHPRIGDKYDIYPMMNFSVAIDDYLMKMTHVLRGKDHLANSEKQKYIYDHMNWKAPEFIHYGKLKMEDVPLSTSKSLEGIKKRVYSGWDDPQLGTLRAIKRRGIQSKTIYNLMIEIGIKMSDSAISWKKIYGLNRNILEKIANRYFFVANPQKIKIEEFEKVFNEQDENNSLVIKRPLHPDFLDRGSRELLLNSEVYLDSDDVKDGFVRLMDGINIVIKGNQAIFKSKSYEEAKEKKARIIQWVSAIDNVEAEIVMPDASVIKGLCESACKNLKVGDVVQFERFGFGRLDEISNEKLIFYFAHK